MRVSVFVSETMCLFVCMVLCVKQSIGGLFFNTNENTLFVSKSFGSRFLGVLLVFYYYFMYWSVTVGFVLW